jgi:hypothetical protein
VAACYSTLQPVVALAVMMYLGEAPGVRNLLGSALIVLGGLAAVALSTNDRRRWKRVAAEVYAAGTRGVSGAAGVGGAGVGGAMGGMSVAGSGAAMENTNTRTYRAGDGTAADDTGGEGGTVRRRREGEEREEEETSTPTPTGTVRMVKVPPRGYGAGSRRRRPKLGTMAWTVAWALVMSLCALAGGGFLTWSLVYLYWTYLC